MHNAGKGVIGMKILGEGRIKEPERRDASLRYVLGLGTVNAFIIGFESTDQVDDLAEADGRGDRVAEEVTLRADNRIPRRPGPIMHRAGLRPARLGDGPGDAWGLLRRCR